MYCKNCGSKVTDGAKFCASCGTPTDDSVSSLVKTTSASSGIGNRNDQKTVLYALIVANIFPALATVFKFFEIPLMKIFSDFGVDSSFSFYNFTRLFFSEASKSKSGLSDAGGMMLFYIIVIYTLALIGAVKLVAAAKETITGNMSKSYERTSVLQSLRITSILSLCQLGLLFIGKIIVSWKFKDFTDVSANMWFYIIIVVAVVCVWYESEELEKGYNSRHLSGESFGRSPSKESWVCICGARNPVSNKECRMCSRPYSRENRTSSSNESQTWVCECGTRNPASQKYCKNCSAPRDV